jgi:GT2 family glycosyltransferase
MIAPDNRVSVVIVTHNRANELLRTLQHLRALPEQPAIVVVDNASLDHTSILVRRDFPDVKLIQLRQNLGAAGRNIGVQQVQSRYVAFSDDDSWWAPGALTQAADLLDAYPQIALLTARILVGTEEREDPASTEMGMSPLPSDSLPGRAVLGFLAGATVFRRDAFEQAGGFDPHFLVGGEEALMALDLVTNGWTLVYAPQLIVYHYPSLQRNNLMRRKIMMRNAIWVAWLRRPLGGALTETLQILKAAHQQTILLAILTATVRGLPWVLRKRRVIPLRVDALYRQL